MREPGLWMITAAAGLVSFFVGSVIESNAITTHGNVGGPGPWIADGLAIALCCVAAHPWSRQPRRQPATTGLGLPTWQGYCIVLLSVVWLALAAATWFLAELTSPTLVLAMLGAAVGHLVGGVRVVRQGRAQDSRERSNV